MKNLSTNPTSGADALDLIKKYPDEVCFIINKTVRNISEDDFQDIYLYLLEHTEQRYNSTYKLSTFICGIARQINLNKIKRDKKHKKRFTTLHYDNRHYLADPLDNMIKRETYETFTNKLRSSSLKTYLVINSIFSKEQSLDKISSYIDINSSTSYVYSIKSKYIENLKEKLIL